MKQIVVFILCSTLFISCNYFKKETEEAAVARVNDTYLYEDDVNKLISEATSAEDSAMIISNYITRWATQQLLIDQAKINQSRSKDDYWEKHYDAALLDFVAQQDKLVFNIFPQYQQSSSPKYKNLGKRT